MCVEVEIKDPDNWKSIERLTKPYELEQAKAVKEISENKDKMKKQTDASDQKKIQSKITTASNDLEQMEDALAWFGKEAVRYPHSSTIKCV